MWEFPTKELSLCSNFIKCSLSEGNEHIYEAGIPGGEAWKGSDHLLPTWLFLTFPLTAQSTSEPPSGMVNES